MNGVFWVTNRHAIPQNAVNLVLSKREINKLTLLDALARACHFPDYFGYNWDATWDLLDEYAPPDLWLEVFSTDKVNDEDFGTFLDLISDAFCQWGIPKLWIITYELSIQES